MSRKSRIATALASLLLVLAFILPLWKITLEAPQYPEGIGMYIMIDTVKGEKENDLQNINGLNHYIGMKKIEPDAIPELRLMPYIFGLLIALGLVAAISGKRWLLYTWVVVFALAAVAGMVDFYLWEYDYGHNLDEVNAIIKIPGMNYQPPLLGSKQILNFIAHSWPGWGGWATAISLVTGMVVSVIEWRRQ